MFKRQRKAIARIDTLIGRNANVQGDIVFSGGLHIDGRVTGNVRGESGTPAALSVSEHGLVEGSVDAPSVVLNGRVNGDISASERVVLGAKARVQGNVYYGVIEMALGAEISGKLVPKNGHGAVAAQPGETPPEAPAAAPDA
ncbi:MAG: polymer-forming cytoskeletal protein [Steroidobacteraceae bacterium]